MEKDQNIRYQKIIAYLLGFMAFVIGVYILTALRDILLPVVIAIFLTYLFHPLLVYLKKHKVPRWLSLVAILVTISVINYLIGLMIISNSSRIAGKLQEYSIKLSLVITDILAPFNITIKEAAAMFDVNIDHFDFNTILSKLFEAGIIQDVFNSVSGLIGDLFIALLFWIFMIMGKSKFEERLKAAYSKSKRQIDNSLTSINHQLQTYLVVKTIISFLTGLIVTVVLSIYGIDFAIFWGLLTFIFNFIPNIGSILISIFPVIIALLEFGLGIKSISLTILLFLNQNIWGNLVEPHYLGRQMDLSVVFVLFSLIFWGWVWGIAGMFLAVPIAALMKILFNNIEPLKPLAILMGTKAELPDDIKPS